MRVVLFILSLFFVKFEFFKEKKRAAMEMVKCPECSRLNKPGYKFCFAMACGAPADPLDKQVVVMAGGAEVKSDARKGGEEKSDATTKATVEEKSDAKTEDAMTVKCPKCEALNAEGYRFCKGCGEPKKAIIEATVVSKAPMFTLNLKKVEEKSGSRPPSPRPLGDSMGEMSRSSPRPISSPARRLVDSPRNSPRGSLSTSALEEEMPIKSSSKRLLLQLARDSHSKIKCSVCGTRNDAGYESCSGCGNEAEEGAQPEAPIARKLRDTSPRAAVNSEDLSSSSTSPRTKKLGSSSPRGSLSLNNNNNNKVKCGACGKENAAGYHFCKSCGAEGPSKQQKDPSPRGSVSGSNKVKCGACGKENAAGYHFCKSCGAPGSKQDPSPRGSGPNSNKVKCGACGKENVAGYHFCKSCGAQGSSLPPVDAKQLWRQYKEWVGGRMDELDDIADEVETLEDVRALEAKLGRLRAAFEAENSKRAEEIVAIRGGGVSEEDVRKLQKKLQSELQTLVGILEKKSASKVSASSSNPKAKLEPASPPQGTSPRDSSNSKTKGAISPVRGNSPRDSSTAPKVKCSACGKENTATATFCKGCGAEQEPPLPPKKNDALKKKQSDIAAEEGAALERVRKERQLEEASLERVRKERQALEQAPRSSSSEPARPKSPKAMDGSSSSSSGAVPLVMGRKSPRPSAAEVFATAQGSPLLPPKSTSQPPSTRLSASPPSHNKKVRSLPVPEEEQQRDYRLKPLSVAICCRHTEDRVVKVVISQLDGLSAGGLKQALAVKLKGPLPDGFLSVIMGGMNVGDQEIELDDGEDISEILPLATEMFYNAGRTKRQAEEYRAEVFERARELRERGMILVPVKGDAEIEVRVREHRFMSVLRVKKERAAAIKGIADPPRSDASAVRQRAGALKKK